MVPTLKLEHIAIDYDEWVNPLAGPTRDRLDAFATRHGLYTSIGLPQKPMLRGHSSVNDYMFPRADPDRLYDTGLMMVYFFLFDHLYDTDTLPSSRLRDLRRRLAPSLLAMIDGRPVGSDPFERAFAEIMTRFDSESEAWMSGFSSRLRRYIEATLAGKEAARERPETSLEQYLEIRQHDSGGLWSAFLIEYAHRLYLTPEQREHPDMLRASQLCMWVCSLINDLFSYAKEKAAEDAPFNAIYFAMRSRSLGELEASRWVADLANHHLAELESLLTSPVFTEDDAAVSYTQGLREFVSGVWFWHLRCGLYVHPRSLFAELRDRPISPSSVPPACPRRRSVTQGSVTDSSAAHLSALRAPHSSKLRAVQGA